MEQSSIPKERLILAAGLVLALAAAALQRFSPVSREIMAGRDVNLALLSSDRAVLMVYHPFSGAVNTFTSERRPRRGASSWQRASDLVLAVSGRDAGEKVFFMEVPGGLSLDPFWEALNGWRENPGRLYAAAAWLRGLGPAGATNISAFDRFRLFSEFAGLGASDFIMTEAPRPAETSLPSAAASRAPMVEVFNASGRNALATDTARRLREMGFDVITVGNRPAEKHTRMISFSADTSAAAALRGALGLEELEIRVSSKKKSVAAAAVVLGEDFGTGTLKEKGR